EALLDVTFVLLDRVEDGPQLPVGVESELCLARVDGAPLDAQLEEDEPALRRRHAELGRLGHDPEVANETGVDKRERSGLGALLADRKMQDERARKAIRTTRQ